MEFGFGLIGTFVICGIILASLKSEDKDTSTNNRSDILYNSSNKNSYIKARKLFQTLEDAGVTPNFLGEKHE